MLIVLDTNVIQEDFLMRSGKFQILFDYVTRTQSKFLLPQIVAEELAGNYERELRGRLAKFIRAKERLNGLSLKSDENRVELDVPNAVAEYMGYVRKRLSVTDEAVVAYSEANLRDAIGRAIQRRRPCSDRGEEIRDAVLWNSILDAASKANETLVFISKNTDQFTPDKVNLHPDLASEVQQWGIKIEYLPSLEEFGKQHATRVAFITKEWLEAQIDPGLVLDSAYDTLMEAARSAARRRAGPEVEGLESFSVAGGGVEADEFFVYAMTSGNFRVEISWFGHIDVEYEVEVEEEEESFDWDHEYDPLRGAYGFQPVRRGRTRRRMPERSVEISLHVITDVLVENHQVADWSKVHACAKEHWGGRPTSA